MICLCTKMLKSKQVLGVWLNCRIFIGTCIIRSTNDKCFFTTKKWIFHKKWMTLEYLKKTFPRLPFRRFESVFSDASRSRSRRRLRQSLEPKVQKEFTFFWNPKDLEKKMQNARWFRWFQWFQICFESTCFQLSPKKAGPQDPLEQLNHLMIAVESGNPIKLSCQVSSPSRHASLASLAVASARQKERCCISAWPWGTRWFWSWFGLMT